MRKWTQQVKLTISERLAQEVDQAYRTEVNEANPSADPLTGPLNDEQKQIVEDRVYAKFDEEIKKTYEGVVSKAEVLLKLQVPDAYKEKKRGNKMMSAMRSQMSMHMQGQLNEAPAATTHMMIQSQATVKDDEYDWRDRLKQWKKVQMAEGAIVELGAKSTLNSNSASIAILGLLQSEFTVD